MKKQTSDMPASIPVPHLLDLPALPAERKLGDPVLGGKLDMLHNIKTRLTVVVGETSMTVGELLSIKAEQIVKLDRLTEAPVDIMLEGHVIARGHLVAVDDNFGVQIIEVPSVQP